MGVSDTVQLEILGTRLPLPDSVQWQLVHVTTGVMHTLAGETTAQVTLTPDDFGCFQFETQFTLAGQSKVVRVEVYGLNLEVCGEG
jgi:hypothetical protein